MADYAEAVRGRLLAHAGTAAIVSTRVTHDFLPQDPTLPSITVTAIDAIPFSAFGADVDKEQCRVQVDCWAATRTAVMALFVQAKAALQRWSGTVGSVVVTQIFLESTGPNVWEDDVKQWRAQMDCRVWVVA